MSESRILVRLLRMYFPRNWEFGSALSKRRNFGGWGVVEHPTPPLGTPLEVHALFWSVAPVNRTEENTEMCTRLCIYILMYVCVCVYVSNYTKVFTNFEVHPTLFS